MQEVPVLISISGSNAICALIGEPQFVVGACENVAYFNAESSMYLL